MNFTWLKTAFTAGKRFAVKNSPTILTVLSGMGTVSAVIFAVKDTPEAERRIEARKQELDVARLPAMEAIKVCWPVYIPTAGMTLVSLLCGFGANSINLRRNAALAGLYATTERTLHEYQNRVIDVIGEEAEKDIRQQAETTAKERTESPASPILSGDELCQDTLSGQYFRADKNIISRWESDVLAEMVRGAMYMSAWEVYDMMPQLKKPTIVEDKGWTIDDNFKIMVDRVDGEDGKVLNLVTFNPPPHKNYYKMY